MPMRARPFPVSLNVRTQQEALPGPLSPARSFRRIDRLMGTRFELVIEHGDAGEAGDLLGDAVAEIRRIESLLTEFSDDSVTARINALAADRPVEVPCEVYDLIRRCLAISRLTQGAFDITVGPLKRLYAFRKEENDLPAPDALRRALACTGYHHVHLLSGNRVRLARPGMCISFAGIGKGYAADRACALMKRRGVSSGAINASGDLAAWGSRQRSVGIADPSDPSRCLMHVPVTEGAVATSGDYEQHFRHGGRRYSHNLNPKTGLPLTGIRSVTVVSPRAELSDAFSTAVYAMGPAAGLHLIDQLDDMHAIVIGEQGDSHFSRHIRHAGHAA